VVREGHVATTASALTALVRELSQEGERLMSVTGVSVISGTQCA